MVGGTGRAVSWGGAGLPVHGLPLYRRNMGLLRNPAIEGEYDVHGLPR